MISRWLKWSTPHPPTTVRSCFARYPLAVQSTLSALSDGAFAQSLDSEGLTTLQVEWSDDLVGVCAARDIERLALVQFDIWKMGIRGTRTG